MKNGQSLWGWWRFTGRFLHRDISRGIKNLIKWFPLVWKDADWDHSYIIDALRFKIKNTANYIDRHKRYDGYERDVERMNLCVRLIDKLQNSDYEVEYQDYYEVIYNFEKAERGYSELKDNVLRDDLKTYFSKYPNDFRRLKDKHNDDIHNALRMGMNRHLRANQLLFKIIERNIYAWWD